MEKNIEISVIITTYNSASYIERTLNSVLEQKELPYEIVIVDDGSSDDTVSVINAYVDKNQDIYKNIYLFQQHNQGAGAARNKAVKEAKGEWIAFLDSDDIWMPEKIKKVKEIISEKPKYTIIAHDEYAVDEDDLEYKQLCNLHDRYDDSVDLFLQLYEGNFLSTSCMVIKKDIIESAGGFDERLRSAQDYDLWIRCGLYGKLYYIPEAYGIYVTRKGNITSNTYRRYLCEMRICRKYVTDLKKQIGDKGTKKIVRKRVYRIHKVETYLALKSHHYFDALKIFCKFLPEVIKRV